MHQPEEGEMMKQSLKDGNLKKRGPGRPKLSLMGRKKLEKANIRKERRRVNRQLGRAGIQKANLNLNPANRKTDAQSARWIERKRESCQIIVRVYMLASPHIVYMNVQKNMRMIEMQRKKTAIRLSTGYLTILSWMLHQSSNLRWWHPLEMP